MTILCLYFKMCKSKRRYDTEHNRLIHILTIPFYIGTILIKLDLIVTKNQSLCYTEKGKFLRRSSQVLTVIITAFWLGEMITMFLQCQPLEASWNPCLHLSGSLPRCIDVNLSIYCKFLAFSIDACLYNLEI